MLKSSDPIATSAPIGRPRMCPEVGLKEVRADLTFACYAGLIYGKCRFGDCLVIADIIDTRQDELH
jgi:hypothetical protein